MFSKKIPLLFLIFAFFGGLSFAQDGEVENVNGFKLTIDHEVKRTAVQNQNRSGTCWSFSALSFLESEIMRNGKEAPNFSEMFIVRNTYADKADLYVRMHGHLNFAGGGAFHDVTHVLEKYGLAPEEAYPGKLVDAKTHLHGEMDIVLKAIVDAVLKNKNKKLSPRWKAAYTAALEAYLGESPKSFTYNETEHTPKSFAKSLGLDANDYVELTSFTHHPFYKPFMLEVPDNWTSGMAYNLPLDEMIESMDYALENGYSIAWASDVSEKGFSYKQGLALVPDPDAKTYRGDHSFFDQPGEELKITQEMRQEGFDNYETQDDHGMHIVGVAHDQEGTKFYLVKNSWGTSNSCGGYLYVSEAYVRYKTTDLMLNKKGIPKKIRKKLGIK